MSARAVPKSQSLRPAQAAAKLGISLPSFWRMVRNNEDFPRPIKLSPRVTVIDEAALDEYLQRKVSEGALPKIGAGPCTNPLGQGAPTARVPSMTLRDYFAAKAMVGITQALAQGIRPHDVPKVAADAYFIADEMLKARDV